MSTYRINHNASAATALNSVSDTSDRLEKLQEQLSTGLRINRASDKPEDFIKAENFKVEILRTEQAKSNALEAISYSRTADAQMNEISNLLHSARGFAQQVIQSGTTDSDLINALNTQLQYTLNSVNDLAKNATYGNKKILDGSAGTSASSSSDKTSSISFNGNFGGQSITTDSTKAIITTTTTTTPSTAAIITGTAHAGYTSGAAFPAAGTVTINGTGFTFNGTSDDIATFISDLATANLGVTATLVGTSIILTSSIKGSAAQIDLTDPAGIIKTYASLHSEFGTDVTTTSSAQNLTSNTTSTLVGLNHAGYTSGAAFPAAGTITINGTSFTFDGSTDSISAFISDLATANIGVTASLASNIITLTNTQAGNSAPITLVDPQGIIGEKGTTTVAATSAPTYGTINLSLTTKAAAATITGAVIPGYNANSANLASAGNININGKSIGSFTTSNTVQNVLDAINNSGLGLTATVDTVAHKISIASNDLGSDQVINLVDTGGIITTAGSTTATGVDAVASVTIGTNTVVFDKGKGTILVDADGNQINLTTAGNGLTLNSSTIIGQVSAGNSLFCVDPHNTRTLNISLQSCKLEDLGLNAVPGQSLKTINLSNPTNAGIALKVIDQAIKNLYNRRAVLGSIQKNTLESAVRSLTVSKENLQASESNIRNLDVAEAITQATRLQILTQSGIAQLAQANQAPSTILNLLRGG